LPAHQNLKQAIKVGDRFDLTLTFVYTATEMKKHLNRTHKSRIATALALVYSLS
jgi:copper(I)-binding protein